MKPINGQNFENAVREDQTDLASQLNNEFDYICIRSVENTISVLADSKLASHSI